MQNPLLLPLRTTAPEYANQSCRGTTTPPNFPPTPSPHMKPPQPPLAHHSAAVEETGDRCCRYHWRTATEAQGCPSGAGPPAPPETVSSPGSQRHPLHPHPQRPHSPVGRDTISEPSSRGRSSGTSCFFSQSSHLINSNPWGSTHIFLLKDAKLLHSLLF